MDACLADWIWSGTFESVATVLAGSKPKRPKRSCGIVPAIAWVVWAPASTQQWHADAGYITKVFI